MELERLSHCHRALALCRKVITRINVFPALRQWRRKIFPQSQAADVNDCSAQTAGREESFTDCSDSSDSRIEDIALPFANRLSANLAVHSILNIDTDDFNLDGQRW